MITTVSAIHAASMHGSSIHNAPLYNPKKKKKILQVPRGVLEFVVGDRVATDEIVVLYCSNGYRAALAAQTMLDLG